MATNKMLFVLFILELNDLLWYIKGQSVKKEILFLNYLSKKDYCADFTDNDKEWMYAIIFNLIV